MNTTYKTSKVVMTAAVLAALFAGCERREETVEPVAATGPAGTTVVTPDTNATATLPPTTAESSGTAASSSAAAAGNTMENSAERAGDKVESATANAGNAIDETVITGKVKAALLADERVKGLDIDVETKQNEVMLSGVVENQSQIDNAEKIAKNIEGVNKVTNKLTVKK